MTTRVVVTREEGNCDVDVIIKEGGVEQRRVTLKSKGESTDANVFSGRSIEVVEKQ